MNWLALHIDVVKGCYCTLKQTITFVFIFFFTYINNLLKNTEIKYISFECQVIQNWNKNKLNLHKNVYNNITN